MDMEIVDESLQCPIQMLTYQSLGIYYEQRKNALLSKQNALRTLTDGEVIQALQACPSLDLFLYSFVKHFFATFHSYALPSYVTQIIYDYDYKKIGNTFVLEPDEFNEDSMLVELPFSIHECQYMTEEAFMKLLRSMLYREYSEQDQHIMNKLENVVDSLFMDFKEFILQHQHMLHCYSIEHNSEYMRNNHMGFIDMRVYLRFIHFVEETGHHGFTDVLRSSFCQVPTSANIAFSCSNHIEPYKIKRLIECDSRFHQSLLEIRKLYSSLIQELETIDTKYIIMLYHYTLLYLFVTHPFITTPTDTYQIRVLRDYLQTTDDGWIKMWTLPIKLFFIQLDRSHLVDDFFSFLSYGLSNWIHILYYPTLKRSMDIIRDHSMETDEPVDITLPNPPLTTEACTQNPFVAHLPEAVQSWVYQLVERNMDPDMTIDEHTIFLFLLGSMDKNNYVIRTFDFGLLTGTHTVDENHEKNDLLNNFTSYVIHLGDITSTEE